MTNSLTKVINVKDDEQFDEDDKEKKNKKLESTYKEVIKVRSLVLQFINTWKLCKENRNNILTTRYI